jgi:two-component system, chemotaxis family, chemotaxis protein CheY
MATRTKRAPRAAATILVVEDDYATRRLYRDALVAAGYEAVAVWDGIGALLYLESHPAPAAVVLNLLLPRVSGHVVYEDLRSRKTTRTTPVVIVTGVELPRFALDEYVTVLRTPIDGNALIAAVGIALGETPSPPVA